MKVRYDRTTDSAAIHWYERGEISQEKAARVPGLYKKIPEVFSASLL